MSFPDTILPPVSGDALEIDELVVRYRFKRRYRYLWIVVSRLTHQVLAWRVGDRSENTLQKLAKIRCKSCGGKFRLPIAASWFTLISMRRMPNGLSRGSIGPAKKAVARPA